jgi:hypothetical protein
MSQLHAKEAEKSPLLQESSILEQRFRNSAYWSLRRLVCIREQDYVIVRGTVPSYYLRQVADSLAASVVGPRHVLSEIRVESDLE